MLADIVCVFLCLIKVFWNKKCKMFLMQSSIVLYLQELFFCTCKYWFNMQVYASEEKEMFSLVWMGENCKIK